LEFLFTIGNIFPLQASPLLHPSMIMHFTQDGHTSTLDKLENVFYVCCMLTSSHPVALILLIALFKSFLLFYVSHVSFDELRFLIYELRFSSYKLRVSPPLPVPYSLLSSFNSELFLLCSAEQISYLNFFHPLFVPYSFFFRRTKTGFRTYSFFHVSKEIAPKSYLPVPPTGNLQSRIPDYLITRSLFTVHCSQLSFLFSPSHE